MKLLPPSIPDSAPPGEKVVFKKFEFDERFNNWVILHSLHVAEHVKTIAGEIDFVALVPHKGILCAEIKSHGNISCKQGQWFFNGKQDKNPFEQVENNSLSLFKYLVSKQSEFGNIPWYHIVVFPRCKFIYDSIEWHEWQVIDKDGCKNFYRSISHSLNSAVQHVNKKTKRDKTYDFNEERVKKVLNILRPEFEVSNPIQSQWQNKESNLKKFTQEQFEALDQMRENPRVLFKGSAGTGKTFLAIEAAKRAANANQKVLLTCFNSRLCDWLRVETEGLNDIDVYNIDKLLTKLNDGTTLEREDEKGDKYWELILPNTILESELLKENRNSYDLLIIDEAQDLLKPLWLDVFDDLLKDGLKKGNWLIFGDFSNQSIFNFNRKKRYFISLQQFEKYLETKPAKYVLYKNCRNIQSVGDFYEKHVDLSPGYSEYLRPNVHGAKGAEMLFCNSISQQVSLTEQISRKLWKSNEDQRIAILSVYDDIFLSRVIDVMETEGIPTRNDIFDPNNKKIFVGTVQSFKGLEADSVILRSPNDLENPEDQNLFYVGCSRARDNLYVLSTNQELENNIKNTDGKTS